MQLESLVTILCKSCKHADKCEGKEGMYDVSDSIINNTSSYDLRYAEGFLSSIQIGCSKYEKI